ncbi:MAG: hypothetical protein RQ715_03390 [Methylococcales bacterium]|nr:hypothetical protein [Methylococcales bacterium]
MSNKKYRPLIIPVENQVRELDAKLLLACAAVEKGFPVVIGSRHFINFAMPYLPRGIFLAKSLRSLSALMNGFIRDLGHEIIAWDEESLVRFSSNEYYAWRYSEKTFSNINCLFSWGADDAELFASYDGYTGVPIYRTGNPRMDLLRRELRGYFADEARALNDKYGEFILINTNFPFVNPFASELALLQSSPDGVVVSRTGRGMSLEFGRRFAAHVQEIYDSFRTLIPQLRLWFPNTTIIVRPHPSENHAQWRQAVAGCDNVHVLHEGNVIPWLMASKVLLHNGCTTAVEAAVLEKPAVCYQPVTADEYDYHLPNGLSHRAYTLEQVRDTLGAILEGKLELIDNAERTRILNQHLASTDGSLAVDRITDILVQREQERSGLSQPNPVKFIRSWIGANIRTAIKLINRQRPNHRNSKAYHDHRYPEISEAELKARIDKFGALLNRFHDIEVTRSSRYIFKLSRKPDAEQQASPANSSSR